MASHLRITHNEPTCAKHPKEITYLRCAACDTPICDRCAVLSPVGYKCRECGLSKQVSLYAPSTAQTVAAGLIALIAGALGGLVLGRIGFFGFWLAFIFGRFVGTMVLKATKEKSGAVMEIVCGIAVVAGGLGLRIVLAMQGLQGVSRWSLGRIVTGAAPAVQSVLMAIDLYTLVIVIILAAAVVIRLRWSWSYRGI
ncbi:MAG: B-box zinc finger protein [Armatimonadota bacterium]